jgi:DNA replication and repair protein RecF
MEPAPSDVPLSRHYLRELEVRDFRNLVDVSVTLPGEGIALVGDNGHGKTNLLEAIAYLHLMRSIRGAPDRDVVCFGKSGFTVVGTAAMGPSAAESDESAERAIVIGFERASRRKRVTLDQVEPERLGDALGALPSVTFSVNDVELVRGGPVGRRRYLDVALATTSRRYLSALRTYRGALVRRNAALRAVAGRGAQGTAVVDAALGAWEPFLANAGATLWAERALWTSRWAPEVARVCEAIGERGVVEMRYAARLPLVHEGLLPDGVSAPENELALALEAALMADRGGDLRRGATRTGPHRDDLVLTIGGKELSAYGSAGQQRTTAISLRIVESYALMDHGRPSPLLLLDDPFAELDERRAHAILELLGAARLGQVVLAVPRDSDIPPGLTKLARFGIAEGVLSRDAA